MCSHHALMLQAGGARSWVDLAAKDEHNEQPKNEVDAPSAMGSVAIIPRSPSSNWCTAMLVV